MGKGGKKAHEKYGIAPAVALADPLEPVDDVVTVVPNEAYLEATEEVSAEAPADISAEVPPVAGLGDPIEADPGIAEPNTMVAPSLPVSPLVVPDQMSSGETPSGGVAFGFVPAEGMAALEAAGQLVAHVNELIASDAGFDEIAAAAEAARVALYAAKGDGAPVQLYEEWWKDLKETTLGYLRSLSKDELVELAASHGFEHPGLVGMDWAPGGKSDHPLVFWLNPVYGADMPQKLNVQDKALQRWHSLQAGGEVGGLDLAAYLKAYPGVGGAPATTVEQLSPAELDELWAQYLELAVLGDQSSGETKAFAIWAALGILHRYANAQCTEEGYQKLVTHHATLPNKATTPRLHRLMLPYLYGTLSDTDGLTPLEVELLGPDRLPQLVMGDGPTKAAAKEHLEAQKAHWNVLASGAGHAVLFGLSSTPIGDDAVALDSLTVVKNGAQTVPTAMAQAAAFLSNAKNVAQAAKALNGHGPLNWPEVVGELGAHFDPDAVKNGVSYLSFYFYSDLPKSFRAWAKNQTLPALRQLAIEQLGGPASLKTATRAVVQNFLVGQFNPPAKAKYEDAVKTAAASAALGLIGGPSAAAPGGSPTKAAATAAHLPPKVVQGFGATPAKPQGKKSFAEKRKDMAAGLAHLAAAHAVVTNRPTLAELTQLKFVKTSAPVSGGAHEKSFFLDEKGRTWMFKPDYKNGARAESEAAASAVYAMVGLPSVPVFRFALEGSVGAMQPIVPHSGTVVNDASQWSQEDVDMMVRYHVASWIAGDHDGKGDNMLRTPAGGIVQIDHGQAWKHVGQDRLSLDYHPNSSWGAEPPVYHQAYAASKKGVLAPGVTVRGQAAAPIIEAFEAMDDTAFRAVVEPVAKLGVAEQLNWYAPMREAAKARFATTAPSPAQIAETFVETLVERKHNVRADFAKFFASIGVSFDDSDLQAQVA